ncbi:MAG: MFS transporter [Bacteroidetes bacterium]|nr:MFS transporter [Bacteroidota bacterium]
MTEIIKQTLRDSKSARWSALIILSFTMFAGYMFTEVISPLKPILERSGINSSDFGFITSAYGLFNVFLFMLIIVGILLDKFGIRFSTIASVLVMIAGGIIKYAAFKGLIGSTEVTMSILKLEITTQVFWAGFGFALFGVGVEYAGITVSKSVAKWFKGKEMALAMGMQVAIARLGSFAPLAFGAKIAYKYDVPTTILIVIIFLILGLMGFIYYNTIDRKLDKQLDVGKIKSKEDDFKISDLGLIIKNRGFWLIAILCVLFYSAVFPFYKYGPDLMVNKFGVSVKWAGLLPSLVPFGTMLLTPFFGSIYDKKGKGATIMIIGAVLLIVVHALFYLPFVDSVVVAFFNVLLLGIAFSLVPSAMWPSVPKIIPEKQLGSAFALIFWVQNFGLWGIPLLVGIVLNSTNPTIVPDKTLVIDTYAEAYTTALEDSPFIGVTDAKGNVIDLAAIKILAKSSGGDLVDKVIAESPQEEVIEYDKEALKQKISTEIELVVNEYVSTMDITDISEIDEKDLAALNKLEEVAISKGMEIVKESKIKLNYNYQKTWTIFVALTFLALFIAFWLKAEDKRKGYGLELPNIKK